MRWSHVGAPTKLGAAHHWGVIKYVATYRRTMRPPVDGEDRGVRSRQSRRGAAGRPAADAPLTAEGRRRAALNGPCPWTRGAHERARPFPGPRPPAGALRARLPAGRASQRPDAREDRRSSGARDDREPRAAPPRASGPPRRGARHQLRSRNDRPGHPRAAPAAARRRPGRGPRPARPGPRAPQELPDTAVDFVEGDFHHLPLPAMPCAVAVAAFCLCHSPRPRDVIAQISEALAPGGLAVLVIKGTRQHRQDGRDRSAGAQARIRARRGQEPTVTPGCQGWCPGRPGVARPAAARDGDVR